MTTGTAADAARHIASRTLMCRDHPVARFRFDTTTQRMIGPTTVLNRTYLPLGCLDRGGSFSTSCLARWLRNRAVPATRPGLDPVLQRLNLDSSEDLLFEGLGLSLSDQYWLKPENVILNWKNINFFDQPFSPARGGGARPA